MVERGFIARLPVNLRFNKFAYAERSPFQFPYMKIDIAPLLPGIGNDEPCTIVETDLAAVSHLAAGFGIERGMVKYQHARLPFVEGIHRFAVMQNRKHGRTVRQPVVTGEIG